MDDVSEEAQAFTWEVMSVLKILADFPLQSKLFVITNNAGTGDSPTALAQAPLYGLGRTAAQEHPDTWGALIGNDNQSFLRLAIKYVQQEDVVHIQDALPRVARLRAFTSGQKLKPDSKNKLLPSPSGAYIITGGLGDLGLEVCEFLAEQGACHLAIITSCASTSQSVERTHRPSILHR